MTEPDRDDNSAWKEEQEQEQQEKLLNNRAYRFKRVSNYRGELQIKKEGIKFFWRVSCNVDDGDEEDEKWLEIPWYLWDALVTHHEQQENK